MSKRSRKLAKVLEEDCIERCNNDAGAYLHDFYCFADRIRNASQVSDKMNEFSEAIDSAMSILVKMEREDIQTVQRLS